MTPPSPRQQMTRQLLRAASAMALAAGLLGWSVLGTRQALAEREQARGEARRLEQQLRQARSEAAAITQQILFLQDLRRSGLTGPADRPAWAATLRTLHRELGLSALHYEFLPATPLPGPDTSHARLQRSPLHVQLGLIHEEDLLRFLDQLAHRVHALTVIHACRLWRDSDGGSGLRADCALDWITLAPPAAP